METLNYNEAKSLVFATGIIADGYSGNKTRVGFARDPLTSRILAVCEYGFFTFALQNSVDDNEAYWLLETHPQICQMIDYLKRV